MRYKAVFFDLDDTLLWDDRSVEEALEATCRLAQDAYGMDSNQLQEQLRQSARELYASFPTYSFTKQIGINPIEALWANFTGGTLPEFRQLEALAPDYRLNAWSNAMKACGVVDERLEAILAESFPKERRQRPYLYPETLEVLTKLKKEHKLLLLTNGAPDLQQEKLDGVPIAAFFDHIVISGDYGRGKPDPGIFQYAMNKIGVTAEEGLMVGDKLTTDILGANRVGMASVWINRKGMTRDDSIIPTVEIDNLRQILQLV